MGQYLTEDTPLFNYKDQSVSVVLNKLAVILRIMKKSLQ
jgi:hypothetical protein